MMFKRSSYDDEILYVCETCGIDFTIAGFVEGSGDNLRIYPADYPTVLCPNDHGWSRNAGFDRDIIPSHDISYAGGF